MKVAVDTNVLSVLLNDEPGADIISKMLADFSRKGRLVLYPYNELKHFINSANIKIDFSFSEEALRKAADAWGNYLRRRKEKTEQYLCPKCGCMNILCCKKCGSVIAGPKTFLADFLIGAHALCETGNLFTLDRGRIYKKYFPTLNVTGPRSFLMSGGLLFLQE